MTGTFKFDTTTGTKVFRTEKGNSVSYSADTSQWEFWFAGSSAPSARYTKLEDALSAAEGMEQCK
jgi:hypothetical protein